MPEARARSPASRSRVRTWSGIVIPGTSLCKNSAWRLEWSGRMGADEHRDRRAAGAREEPLQDLEVVDGLRLHPASPRLDLAVEALDLAARVRRRRVEGRADAERRRLADARARRVPPLVQV